RRTSSKETEHMSIRAAVIGAKGRMGSHAVEAINEAEGIDLVATLGSSDSLETLLDADIDVAVELTVPKSTEDNVRFLVEHDIDTVVGTTGWDNDRLTRLEATLAEHPKTAVLIAPNFSIGAVLAMRFAELAAPSFDSAEVAETPHTRKRDAPSGTAHHTAQRLAAARHSAGLPPVPASTASTSTPSASRA